MKLYYYCTKSRYLIPFVKNLMMEFPILRSIPALDIGTPVARLIFCLTFVIPNARFHEKLKPGMSDFCLCMPFFVLLIPI